MENRSGNRYQLDGVIEAADSSPVVLLESKYLRYKKHNRDKGSWTCAAHYSLRKSWPSVRKGIAVISGKWSEPAKKFMESFGIELFQIPFDHMCGVLKAAGVDFDWDEKDRATPRRAIASFKRLTEAAKRKIAVHLVDPIRTPLVASVEATLSGGEDWAKRLKEKEVELLLKTDRNEYFVQTFPSARDAITYLVNLQDEPIDIRGRV